MRIGVVSDSHGDAGVLHRVLADAGTVALWLHAGDYYRDGRRLAELSGLPVTGVAGNCDRTQDVPADEYIEAAGKKIWLTHGHRQHVKYGVDELVWWGRQYGVDIVVFGHTHIPYNHRHQEILIFNPGSPGAPRGGAAPSYGILEIHAGGTIEGTIREL
ncbi:metallophosphoesterase family protein [Sporomusa termitida]|uniref:Phosphoesterase n=1 Tax=Sporomusa termitida TaxID=2377 RepID=A0A517DR23_9FIRM|nr:metallophosphoesterase [Sporomusa termitida]QDR79767.1 PhosphodieSPTERase YfcE [Sporomusa termitida]